MFNVDKDVLLIASHDGPEISLLYDTLELKDGILIIIIFRGEHSLLHAVQNENPYILLCGDHNARCVVVGTDVQRIKYCE